MAYKKTHMAVLPGKQWFYRGSLLLMATAGVALMVMSKNGNPMAANLRNSIADAVTPVLEVASRPIDAVAGVGSWLADMSRLRAENVALKNQNLQLLQWQSIAKEMEAENRSLRELLHVVPGQKRSYVTARIVSDLGGPYVHAALLSSGTAQNIQKDQAVINENGLVGRVIEAGERSARVLLLTDINSRVPVMTEGSREKTILAGNNDGLPQLSYLATDSKIAVGDRVITSGDGGIFPAGIPVGVVTSAEPGKVQVQPFVDATKAEYVSVVSFAP